LQAVVLSVWIGFILNYVLVNIKWMDEEPFTTKSTVAHYGYN